MNPKNLSVQEFLKSDAGKGVMAEWKFDDARMPTETERQHLARLMYVAFCDLRRLALAGRNEQVKDLAEAFHNIPLLMYTDKFSFKTFRDFLGRYQQKHEGQPGCNYLQEWDRLSGKEAAT